MFAHLTDFSYRRTPLQAGGLYILGIILTVALSWFFSLLSYGSLDIFNSNFGLSNGLTAGFNLGRWSAVLVSEIFLALIIISKKLYHEPWAILLLLATAPLAYFGGGPLGLIPGAYLSTTTRKQQ